MAADGSLPVRYSDLKKIPDDSVLILVHIPRTSGTSFRTMVAGMVDPRTVLWTYRGEIDESSAEALSPIRFVSGHVAYGLDRYFSRPCQYISFVRDPFDRFISLYSVFRTNEANPGHALASKYDINDYLKACLDPVNAWHHGQINNRQTRLICGEASFDTAQRYVLDRYYAVLPFEEVGNLPKLAAAVLGRQPPSMPHVNNTKEKRKQFSAESRLSDESLQLLSVSEREDILLHSYVRARASVLSDDPSSADLQSGLAAFGLDRHRELWAPARPATSPTTTRATNCPICGGESFAAGPNGRLTQQGLAPRCEHCGALERHRVVWNLMRRLPTGFLDWRRGIQFSRDGSLNESWFRTLEYSQYDDGGLDLQAIDRPDGSFDFISLNHVLESVPDDRAAMRELARVVSDRGMLQLCFGLLDQDEDTQEYSTAKFEWMAVRRYGRDVLARLGVAAAGLHAVVVEGLDPCTDARVVVHCLFKDGNQANFFLRWVLASDAGLRLLEANG